MVEEASPKPSEAADRRVASMIVAATESSSPLIAGYLKAAAPTVGKAVSFAVNVVGPPAMALARLALASYELLPVDLLSALLGVGLSFGGGAYCASITAVDAFRMGGWEQSRAALLDINADVRRVLAAHEADEKKDEDGNGVPDVRQLTSAQLLQRKMSLALQAVENPSKLSAALGGLYTAWLAVQGTLRLEFARTITLGLSIAESCMPTTTRLGVPLLAHLLPPQHHKWSARHSANAARRAALGAWPRQRPRPRLPARPSSERAPPVPGPLPSARPPWRSPSAGAHEHEGSGALVRVAHAGGRRRRAPRAPRRSPHGARRAALGGQARLRPARRGWHQARRGGEPQRAQSRGAPGRRAPQRANGEPARFRRWATRSPRSASTASTNGAFACRFRSAWCFFRSLQSSGTSGGRWHSPPSREPTRACGDVRPGGGHAASGEPPLASLGLLFWRPTLAWIAAYDIGDPSLSRDNRQGALRHFQLERR